MSTSSASKVMSQRTDSVVRAGSASITRLTAEKGSKSIIPKSFGMSSIPKTMTTNHQPAGPRPSSDEIAIQNCGVASKAQKTTSQSENPVQPNPGEQIITPRSRASALPTFTGLQRTAVSKSGVSSNGSTTKVKPLPVMNTLQKRQLENQFANKRLKYMTLRKEVIEKQKQASDLYEDVTDLREKVIAAGLKDPGKIEKVATGMTLQGKNGGKESPAYFEGGAAAGEQLTAVNYSATSVVTSEFIGTLEGKLNDLTNGCLEVCQDALAKRMEIISWLAGFSQENEVVVDTAIIKGLEIYESQSDRLQMRLNEVIDKQRVVINELLQNISALWGEHENYRIHIRELETSGEGLVRDLKEKLRAAIEDLESEKEKSTQLRDRKNSVDAQLQKSRNKIRELESHANSNEAKINQLQATVKSLELQIKQKESALEARTKDMHRSIKNSESLQAKAEKQRDSLESRVTELKKKIDSKEMEYNQTVASLSKELEDVKNHLVAEKDLKCRAEERVKELSDRCSKLEEKSQRLCELAEQTKEFVMKPADGKYTETELQLWHELRTTRTALAERDQQLFQVQQEKEKITSVLHLAADREDPGSVTDKLAAELVTKTENLQAAILDRTNLQKNLKAALEKSDKFERQLSELQGRLHAQSKEGGKAGWGAHAIELQQQLSDLRTTLSDLTRQNEELETALTRKQLELEQRDLVMKAQSKVLKARDEVIGLLKGQTGNPSRESTSSQNGMENVNPEHLQLDPESISRLVNKQIAAKSEDLQMLYSILESKQIQLMRLEKVVQQMENDNDRSQATRTKLEKEVARLRLQLHEKNREQRYVVRESSCSPGPPDSLQLQQDRPKTSPQILLKPNAPRTFLQRANSPLPLSLSALPKLPISVPIRSRNPSPRAKSANPISVGVKIPAGITREETPSMQKLNDIQRAVENERARGTHVSRRVSRSLRGSPVRNSSEIREDLYNWLMQPTEDAACEENRNREFVRHSRALLNGELFRSSAPSDGEFIRSRCGGQRISRRMIGEGSREFRKKNSQGDCDLDSAFWIRPTSPTRTPPLIRVRRCPA